MKHPTRFVDAEKKQLSFQHKGSSSCFGS